MSEHTIISPPANPGASATATLFDNNAINGMGVPLLSRINVTAFIDQDCTFKHEWSSTATGTLRTVNGAGSGETMTASVLFERDVMLLPGRNKISITTATAPSTWQVSIGGETERALGQ